MADTNNTNSGNTNGGDNTVFNLEGATPSPGQMTMFDGSPTTEEVTKMEIPHTTTMGSAPAAQHEEEGVSSGTKIKILATLVIVGIAGYAAYWVQEPVQLKTDVLGYNSTPADAPAGSTPTGTDAPAGATGSPAGAVADNSAPVTSGTTPSTEAGQSVNVDVSLFGFDPASLQIEKGTTVVWTNTSTEDQTIIGTAPDGESFASPVLTSGQTFSYKFEQDADFEYYSTYNPALKATIKVGAGSVIADSTLPAETTSAPADATAANTTSTPAETTAPTGTSPDLGLGTAAPETSTTSVLPVTTSYPYDMSALAAGTSTLEQLHEAAPAEITPSKLSKTGPAEDLYAVILVGIVWLNRKKLAKVFQK